MALTTGQIAVLRIIGSSVALYMNFKFFFARVNGPSQPYKTAFLLAIILAALLGYRKGNKLTDAPSRSS